MHEKIAIFGYPRSGTKLLASVLTQQGYFNLGEFFESYSTHIELNPLRAVRTDRGGANCNCFEIRSKPGRSPSLAIY